MTDQFSDAVIDGGHPALEPAPAPRRKRRVIGWVAGALAVLLVGGATAAVLVIRAYNQAPVQATERFLTALADGDLATVEEFFTGDVDMSLVTQEVLDASLEAGPIADIEVTGDRDGVEASFTIGGEKVSRSFDVDEVDGQWVIWDAVTPLPWLADYTSVDLRVNGAEIPDADAMVLPGTYALTLDSPYFALEGKTTHAIVSDADADLVREAKVVMSPEGAATFTQVVNASLQECLAMTSATSSCGVDIDLAEVKGTFAEGSAVRTLTADDQALMASLPHILLSDQLTTVRVAKPLTVDVDFSSNVSDGTWEYDWDGYLLWPHVDFSVEPLQVSWSQ